MLLNKLFFWLLALDFFNFFFLFSSFNHWLSLKYISVKFIWNYFHKRIVLQLPDDGMTHYQHFYSISFIFWSHFLDNEISDLCTFATLFFFFIWFFIRMIDVDANVIVVIAINVDVNIELSILLWKDWSKILLSQVNNLTSGGRKVSTVYSTDFECFFHLWKTKEALEHLPWML